jgi:hypothetical protein
MSKKITTEDLELLSELGVEEEKLHTGGRPTREQHIIAGFGEIERFVREHGRHPEHGEKRDIFERIYAVRLDRIRQDAECRTVLSGMDELGLLGEASQISGNRHAKERSDAELLADLGAETVPDADVTKLVHVRPREEVNVAEEIAQRIPCQDFESFREIFERVKWDLESGKREAQKYAFNAEVSRGDLFILDGQKIIVAEMREPFVGDHGRLDRRLRVVYDNGTESDLLLRSLQRALNKDKASRRIVVTGWGPIFSDMEEEDDLPTGYIYVLRSKSEDTFISKNRLVIHKIGVTGGDVKSRLANAKKDSTYLLAEVDLVATYKLANINRRKLEALIHNFFSQARLDIELKDRFGSQVEPREWFLVPLPVIEEAIQKIMNGTIGGSRYNPQTARLVEV